MRDVGREHRAPSRRGVMRMRLGTALLVPLVVALPLGRYAAASAANHPAASQDVAARLSAATGGKVTIAKNAGSGRVGLIGATPDHPFPRAAGLAKNASAEQSARGFLRDYGTVLGVADESKQLRALPRRPGSRAVRFQQLFNGVPVIAGELTVDVLPDGSVVSADGETSSEAVPSTTPTVTSADAAQPCNRGDREGAPRAGRIAPRREARPLDLRPSTARRARTRWRGPRVAHGRDLRRRLHHQRIRARRRAHGEHRAAVRSGRAGEGSPSATATTWSTDAVRGAVHTQRRSRPDRHRRCRQGATTSPATPTTSTSRSSVATASTVPGCRCSTR